MVNPGNIQCTKSISLNSFDFKNKTKLEAVVYAIHLFLTWYNEQL
jgi:hypothetical protein